MFSLRAVQATGRSLPLTTSMTLRHILCHQLSKASTAKKTIPTTAASSKTHNVTLPWPSTPSEPDIKPLNIEFLHQAANSKAKVEAGDMQTLVTKQKEQLLQQEKDIKRLKELVMQPGFQTQKKWVYERRSCGEVGVGVEVEGKRRLLEMLEKKKGQRERYDVL